MMSLRGKTALCLCVLFAVAFADEGCDKSKCKGPVKYYEELNCKPVYEKPGDCCAVRYDCSHLEGRSANKCYAKGHEYSPGDQLKDEDRASPCDIGCRCNSFEDRASFMCAAVDCFHPPPKAGCYMVRKPENCCPTEYCPKEGEKVFTCEVDGKSYREGETFYPNNELTCTCQEGFKGELVEPFCKKGWCGTEMRRSSEILQKCIPVHYHGQSAVTGCSIDVRCPNDKDEVIAGSGKSASSEQSPDMKCSFGKLSLNIGDELKQGTDYDSTCVKCVCEVPPTPTCHQLNRDECQ